MPSTAKPAYAKPSSTGRNSPEDTYGRRNREDIAARETQIATRLRATERAYRTALDHNVTSALQPPEIPGSADRSSEHQLELE
jgi:hypothetical protein